MFVVYTEEGVKLMKKFIKIFIYDVGYLHNVLKETEEKQKLLVEKKHT